MAVLGRDWAMRCCYSVDAGTEIAAYQMKGCGGGAARGFLGRVMYRAFSPRVLWRA